MASDENHSGAGLRSSPESVDIPEPQVKIKVSLTGVAETLFITLAARTVDAMAERPILGDSYARDVLEKLDYDVVKATMSPSDCARLALRTRYFDRWTATFLASHPRCTVLHLACGLDSRVRRVNWGNETRWIDVDLPEVIALRRQVLPQSLTGRDYRLLSADVTDSSWLEDIPVDRPTVVVIEGLLSYLQEQEVEELLSRLVDRLPEGELLFECLSTKMLFAVHKRKPKTIERTGAQFQWGIDDLKKLLNVHARLELLEAINFFEAPGVEELPIFSRVVMYILSWIPVVRESVRLVRFGFGPPVSEQVY